MTTIFYSTPRGPLLRIIDRTQDPQERAEWLLLARCRYFPVRRVQNRQRRLAAKGGK